MSWLSPLHHKNLWKDTNLAVEKLMSWDLQPQKWTCLIKSTAKETDGKQRQSKNFQDNRDSLMTLEAASARTSQTASSLADCCNINEFIEGRQGEARMTREASEKGNTMRTKYANKAS
jgi:hypothetical protein